MKKISLLLILIFLLNISIIHAKKRESISGAVKFIIHKADKALDNYNIATYILRAYQYTSTSASSNPLSFILSPYGEKKSILKESGLRKKDKGRFLKLFKNRNKKNIKRLWRWNKRRLYKIVSKKKYKSINKSMQDTFNISIDRLLMVRNNKKYNVIIKKLIESSEKVKEDQLLGLTYNIVSYEETNSLLFWYRRTLEKNDDIIYKILKEIQKHYKDKPKKIHK